MTREYTNDGYSNVMVLDGGVDAWRREFNSGNGADGDNGGNGGE